MRRTFYSLLAAALLVSPALAASPKIETAVKTFKAVAADPAKLKTFCEMTKAMASAGEKEDKVAEEKIDALMKQLGSDFESAWTAGDELTDETPDGKAYLAGVDELVGKCPK